MFIRIVLSLLILLGTLPIARADDASKMAKINELFQVMDTRAIVDQARQMVMAYAFAKVSKSSSSYQNMTAEQQVQIKQFYGKVEAIIANALSWEKLEPLYAKAYADAFTEQQLDGMIAFYKTPTGKVMLKKLPMLQKQLLQIGDQQMVAAQPKIREALEDFKKQVSAQPKSIPPKAADQK